MRRFAYFTVPTLAGWLVGSLTCAGSMTLLGRNVLSLGDIYEVGRLAGLFIIAPTFALCILPYCGVALHTLRTSKSKSHCRFYAWPLFLCLVVLGSIMTFVPAGLMFGYKPSLRSSLPPENPVLWLLPFIPYAAVVAFLSRLFFGLIRNHDT